MRTVELPPALSEAAAGLVAEHGAGTVREVGVRLSARYRAAPRAPGPVARTPPEVAAYLTRRLPATYAAVAAALLEAERAALSPRTLLDVGAGPGTALWGAAAAFPSLERAVAVEAVAPMAAAGRKLAAVSPSSVVRHAAWVVQDVRRGLPAGSFDLVTVAFVLNELSDADGAALVREAWSRAAQALVIVEPGTPEGYRRVLDGRAAVLALGGVTAAPCPHDRPCPMAGGDWCHFAVRVPRSAEHRAAKGGRLGHEDEKYSYAVLARDGVPERALARILRHPQARGGHVRFELCTPAGLRSAVVSKRDGAAFKRARDASWGDDLRDGGVTDAAPSPLQDGSPTAPQAPLG